MKISKNIIKNILTRNIFYAQVLITASFLVPIYVLYVGNIDLNLIRYFNALSSFLAFGGTCLLASFLAAVVFELIDNKISSIYKNIILKILFSISLFAIAIYFAIINS